MPLEVNEAGNDWDCALADGAEKMPPETRSSTPKRRVQLRIAPFFLKPCILDDCTRCYLQFQ